MEDWDDFRELPRGREKPSLISKDDRKWLAKQGVDDLPEHLELAPDLQAVLDESRAADAKRARIKRNLLIALGLVILLVLNILNVLGIFSTKSYLHSVIEAF